MSLRLYNTMGHKMQEFSPVKPGHVGFYGCGPTVYNYAHIGNLRAYVFLDILDKTLTYLGYDITHVMNITDVGHLTGDADDGTDKMVKTAEEKHQSVLEVARFYTEAFHKDIDRLNIRRPDIECKATEHIQEMIELIQKIEANGHTYTAGGNLYYDVTTFPDYGKLANIRLDELKAGAGERDIVVVDENKRNPSDFVLWFTKSKFENQALTWDSPWGRGYPGWHIECSAMSMKYLGKHIDIHTGGIDHVPIHHTNEIAQSEGSFTEAERAEGPWVHFWLHNEFLVIAKDKKTAASGGAEKMSKSHGNFLTLQSIIDKGYDALDYRFFLLGGHYRKQIYFSWDAMDSARQGREALVQRVAKLVLRAKNEENLELTTTNFAEKLAQRALELKNGGESENLRKFREGLENDLATPVALSALQKESSGKSRKAADALADIYTMDSVLSLDSIKNGIKAAEKQRAESRIHLDSHEGDSEAAEITALVEKRTAAKKAKDFAEADRIRNELSARGITLTDTPDGVVWKRI